MSAVAFGCALAISAGLVRAQSILPTGWSSRDIGSTGVPGSAEVSSGIWTIEGSGANISGSSDEFHFAYQQITGDVDIRVRVASFDDVHAWSKTGVMIRETLSGNARNAFMMVTPSSGRFLQFRATQGGTTTRRNGVSGAAPVWLRLVRQGSQFTGYFSANGASWTTAGTATIDMTTAAYVGLAVSSRVDSTLATATFSDLQVAAGPATTTLPAPWTSRDLGSPALTGSASAAGGTFTVTAGGIDIWDTSDQFHFVNQPLQGDVEVIARVASLQYADGWSKAGVMVRETLTGASRHASMVATGTQGWSFQRRIATGDTSYHQTEPGGAAPGWVRLVREGNLFSAYRSTDGSTWSLVGSDTISMASTVYVGLAVTSHNPGARATATFTSVTARTLDGTNQPPTVAITAPAAGASFTEPATITVTATASDTDGTITKVDFYRGSELVGSDFTNTYTATLTDAPAGTYQLTAVATDSDGVTSTSSPVSVTVNSPTNQAPGVSLTSPSSGATFTAPASIAMSATASDSDGTVARVDFYQGSTLLYSDASSPYGYTWTNVAAGSYQVTAIARDDDGAARTSTGANITVTAVTTTLPAPWTSRDLGSPALAGSASASGSTFTVTAGGIDIWDTSDQFHFINQPLQGNVEVIARVGSLQYADGWSKAGVMVRETLTGASRHASMVATGTQGWSFQRRIATGDTSYHQTEPGGAAPGWVRLVREGNLFSAYRSTDGGTWSLVGSATISMASTVYVGLAVTSHNPGARATATFTNVTARTLTPGTNQPPTVAIISPIAGQSFTAPASLTIAAAASDSDGTIAGVDFYVGSQVVATDSTSPYQAVWSNVLAGSYSLTAVARDNSGGSRTSGAVAITVTTVAPRPTTVIFAPSADHATNVTSYTVAIYRGADPVTASPVATGDLGKPAPVGGDISVDISTLVNPLPAGTYKAVVRASGPGGTTASTASPNFTK